MSDSPRVLEYSKPAFTRRGAGPVSAAFYGGLMSLPMMLLMVDVPPRSDASVGIAAVGLCLLLILPAAVYRLWVVLLSCVVRRNPTVRLWRAAVCGVAIGMGGFILRSDVEHVPELVIAAGAILVLPGCAAVVTIDWRGREMGREGQSGREY